MIVSRTLLLYTHTFIRPRWVEIAGVFAEDSLEGHTQWSVGVSACCVEFTEFLVSAGCVRYIFNLRDEVSLRTTSSGEV